MTPTSMPRRCRYSSLSTWYGSSANRSCSPRVASSAMYESGVWPSGTWKVGSMGLPSFSSRLTISVIRCVLCTASGTSLKAFSISSGEVTYSLSVSCRIRLPSASVLPDAMHMSSSCARASSRLM